jgi:hypothetical protein
VIHRPSLRPMQAALAALLPVTLLLAAAAGFPVGAAIAPVRLAAMRGALVTGTVAVLAVEGLGAPHQLTGGALVAVWSGAAAVCAAIAWYRHRRRLVPWIRSRPGLHSRPRHRRLRAGLGVRSRAADREAGWAWPELVLAGGVLAITAVELVIALVSPPNNADSLGYHLPRVEHWAQDRSVEFYPTAVHRQVGFSPGAEYLLLHLRLLAGPEEFYNLMQWAAALGCAVAVSRIAAQLGAGRCGQLLAAATVASAPLVVLEATSTQTDLVAGFWVATGASLALSGLRARAPWPEVAWLGAATGLATVTKVNALAPLAPFLLVWAVGQARANRAPHGGAPSGRAAAGRAPSGRAAARAVAAVAVRAGMAGVGRCALRCAAVVAVTAVLAGPFTVRCAREWGTPAGDPAARIIALGRHDPAAVGVNAARIAVSVLATGSAGLNARTGAALDRLAAGLRLPARDPALTFTGLPFQVPTPRYPDEDRSAYPMQALAVLCGVGLGLLGRRRTAEVRGYAAAAALGLLLTAALVAWQPWINRLVLPTFIAAVPLVGWAAGDLAARLRARGGRRWAAGVLATLVLLAGYREATVALWYGQPRPLAGRDSVLAAGRDRIRYVRGRDRRAAYEAAAARLATSGARRIGVVQSNVGWEYAWWEGPRRYGVRPEVVSLTSVLPRHPAPGIATVDAVVCTLDAVRCARWLPRGWHAVTYRGVSVLLPEPVPLAGS